eukprot:g2373.t1
MPDWLGCKRSKFHPMGGFAPFEDARAWVRQRKMKSKKEWQEWSKSGQRPSNIPSHPHEVYRGKGWVSYMDWLGTTYNRAEQGRQAMLKLHRKRKRAKEPNASPGQPATSSASSSSSSSSSQPLENCAICFEPLCPVTTNISHLACVHTFHVHCLAPLAHASAGPSTSSRRGVLLNCPLCRKRCRYLPEVTVDDEDDDGYE